MITITANKNITYRHTPCILEILDFVLTPRIQTRSQTLSQRKRAFCGHIRNLLEELGQTQSIPENVIIATKIFDYICSHKNVFNAKSKSWEGFRTMVWDKLTEFEKEPNFPPGRALYYKGALFPI